MQKPIRSIHLVAIGGTGMAPLACLLKEAGYTVGGSDAPLYPPMSDLLATAGIEPLVGFQTEHLDSNPDLVVIGNAVPRSNVEAVTTEERGLDFCSMPEALYRFFLADRKPLVVAGTHGKTTTTSIAAWVFADCDADPGFLIGGVPLDFDTSFRRGDGARFVLEGDEYNAAYFDRGPKFLHYRAETLVLTSAEYDHADLYPTPESLDEAYGALIEQLPESGRLIACGDSSDVRRLAERCRAEVIFYGLDDRNQIRPVAAPTFDASGAQFQLHDPEAGEIEVHLQLTGRHNVANALAVWAAARADGIPAAKVARALGRFRGVKRRMEELGTFQGRTIVDDFAHHPTAVETTVDALRQRYPGRRLVILYEPRSLTAGRSFLQQEYVSAFSQADRVYLAPIFHHDRLDDVDRLDLERLIADLGPVGVTATRHKSVEQLIDVAIAESRDGDVLATMSSGAFGGAPHALRRAFE